MECIIRFEEPTLDPEIDPHGKFETRDMRFSILVFIGWRKLPAVLCTDGAIVFFYVATQLSTLGKSKLIYPTPFLYSQLRNSSYVQPYIYFFSNMRYSLERGN